MQAELMFTFAEKLKLLEAQQVLLDADPYDQIDVVISEELKGVAELAKERQTLDFGRSLGIFSMSYNPQLSPTAFRLVLTVPLGHELLAQARAIVLLKRAGCGYKNFDYLIHHGEHRAMAIDQYPDIIASRNYDGTYAVRKSRNSGPNIDSLTLKQVRRLNFDVYIQPIDVIK